jgi:hypothetical protein
VRVECLVNLPGAPQIGPMRFLVAAFVALWPVAANAQDLTPEQVRADFSAAGYVTDAPGVWASGVTTISVHDPNTERTRWPVVRAFIYSDAAAAEQARGAEQLLAGYGAPLWFGNVALIQVSRTSAAFPTEPDCAPVLESPAPVVLDGVREPFSSVLLSGGDA